MQEMRIPSLDWEDLLEEEMATHSSIFAWRLPRQWRLLGSIGLQRVRHN